VPFPVRTSNHRYRPGVFKGEPDIGARVREAQQVYLPIIVLAELYFGAEKSPDPERKRQQIDRFLPLVWHAPAAGERGGQPIYSAIAIQTGLALRLVFHQPLGQTAGICDRSPTCSGLMGLSLMDHSLAITASNQGQPVRLILARTPLAAAERRISRRRARCSGSM